MEGYLQYRRLVKTARTTNHKNDLQDASPDLTQSDKEDEPKFVRFAQSDHHNPRQWTYRYKLACVGMIWLLVFVTGWASAATSTAHAITAHAFHVSEVAESLATSMYLFGVGVGAVVAGPCSETLGRLFTYLATFSLYLVWIMASALANNFGSQIVFRFLAGLFASASMSIYGGSLADLFDTDDRALIWPFFALSPLLGPTMAPLFSGWVAQYLGWRWVDWVTLIISGASFLVAVLFLPETFAPLILSFKARTLRQATMNSAYQSEYDQSTNVSAKLGGNLQRIGYLLVREPTTLLFGFYLTLLYVLIYGFLEGFDYVFSKTYNFDVSQRYSAFAAICIGILLALPYVVFTNRFPFVVHQEGATKPEHRLLPALFASPLLAISLFWIGWTDRPDIAYWSVIVACGLFGFTLMALFTSTYHFLLDTYGENAASAMAAITVMRYMVSGGIVLATEPMYTALTVKWTLTLLGCVAAMLSPVPWLFWRFGSRIRAKSRWAAT